jgi:DNA repair exonuclease SbcCD ATPase subunit
MKTIEFNKLEISNFKGIERQVIIFDSKTSLRGANGTGKTTIADAIWWVLFNKDSGGAKDFPVKRKDALGNDIHNIIVDVCLNLSINGTRHIFRRSQEENWITKRGSTDPVMEGNVQSLYYNESKLKSKEYEEAVSDIVDEESFKLLTNPMYFMTQIDYKKRREILMRLVGNESDIENSIRNKSEYYILDAEWKKDLNLNKTFGQFFETMKQKAKQNQDEIDRLPYQIDELKRTIKKLPDEVTLKSLINGYTKELSQLTETKPSEKPKNILEAEQMHYEKTILHKTIIDKANDEYASKRSETARIRQDYEYRIASLESKVTLLRNDIESDERNIVQLGYKKADLLAKYGKIKNEAWTAPVIETNCPVCHQLLPDLNIDKLMADDKLNFEQNRALSMNETIAEGKEIAQRIDAYKVTQITNKKRITNLEEEIEEFRMKLSGLPDVSLMTPGDFVDQKKVEELKSEITALKSTVDAYYYALSNNTEDVGKSIRKQELQALISDNNQRLGALNAQKETLTRIDELTKIESVLVSEKNRYKTLVFQCEQFEREKNEVIEQQLSSHFGLIKWRLFKSQVNGGYQQVCDPLLDGKPYDAQSTGERIFTGCDIIKCFQVVYDTEAPVLIDNRESLTLPVPLNSQTISMYADDRYTNLKQV